MGGFFGIVSKGNCVEDLYYGIDYHSHLGTMFGGMAVFDDGKIYREIHSLTDPFRSKLKKFVNNVEGKIGIGIISDYEEQPLYSRSKLGEYSIVHVGRVNNLDSLVKEAEEKSSASFSEITENGNINPVELISYLINQEENFVRGIENIQSSIEGSSSLMLLTENGIYLARDKLGRTPLIIGKRKSDDAFAATLETCAFPNLVKDKECLGFEIERYLGPGEIGILTEKGYEQLKKPLDNMQICSFLWVYYGYPASSYEGINVELMRYKSGEIHAEIDKEKGIEIDIVAGIPDSGTAHAIGYANKRGIPYKRPFVKYTPSWARSFMPQDQETRDKVGRMKLIPIKDLIKGAKLLFCEDSIVRGTQLKDTIRRLYDYGAEKIHMRPACPPLKHSCKFLNFSISKSPLALAGRKAIVELDGENADVSKYNDENSEDYERMVDRVRQRLSLSSLRYQKLDDMVSAIGLSKEKLCTYCWDGCEGCKV